MNRDVPDAAPKVQASGRERASCAADAKAVDEVAADSQQVIARGQRSLFGTNPEPSDSEGCGLSPADRIFFPCNREDALLLLAGLCVSTSFPDAAVRLAIQKDELALIDDGLRLGEEILLCEGRPELFPVLIELRLGDVEAARRTLEHRHVLQLVFRTQDEADAFRYRPVDEFDTQTFACAVDGACFGLEGAARFELRAGGVPELTQMAGVIDRVLAGIHSMLCLGRVEPWCWRAIASFLAEDERGEGGADGFSLKSACNALSNPLPVDAHRHRNAIVRAFAKADNASPSALLDAITGELSPPGNDQKDGGEVEARWLEVARDVTRNRIALTGDRLSDEKSVFLRGALLAIIADSTEALVSFRRAEMPSGPRVTSLAAFLVGLKQGLLGMSWSVKGPQARELSAAAASLLRSLSSSGKRINQSVSVARAEDKGSAFMRVLVGDVQLADWATDEETGPNEVESAWLVDFQRLGYTVSGKGADQNAWLVTLPSGERIEVQGCAIGRARFPALKWYPASDRKLKKPREIDTAFRAGGRLWYPRYDSEGRLALCCELAALPAFSDLRLIEDALREAVGLCAAAQKPVRRRKKTASPQAPD